LLKTRFYYEKRRNKNLGQKVNPIGLRLGIVKTWDSRWYAKKNYADYVLEDYKIREFLKKKLYHAGISKIEIERSSNLAKLRIYAARPGIIIGKKGVEIAQLKSEIEKKISHEVSIDIQEVRKPEIDAQLVAENIALQIERRAAFRKAMKRGIQSAMRFGAQGIKVICAGRLGGAEMARREQYKEGRVPLHTLRADSRALSDKHRSHFAGNRGERACLPRRASGPQVLSVWESRRSLELDKEIIAEKAIGTETRRQQTVDVRSPPRPPSRWWFGTEQVCRQPEQTGKRLPMGCSATGSRNVVFPSPIREKVVYMTWVVNRRHAETRRKVRQPTCPPPGTGLATRKRGAPRAVRSSQVSVLLAGGGRETRNSPPIRKKTGRQRPAWTRNKPAPKPRATSAVQPIQP
jgi:small subunit ribosomal protein S3